MSKNTIRREEQEKELVQQFFSRKNDGFFVEVGANDPVSKHSQTWYLADKHGWHGILIEPIKELADKAREKRPESKVYQVACGQPGAEPATTLFIPSKKGTEYTTHASLQKEIDGQRFPAYREQEVKVMTLNEIFAAEDVKHIDLLSIDTEGTELEVLRGIDLEKYRPTLIILEDKHVFLDKHLHLIRNGYRPAKRMGMNMWYIPKGEPFGRATLKERLKLFKRLYLSLLPRKIKAAWRLKSWHPLLRI
mgnify:FL=1